MWRVRIAQHSNGSASDICGLVEVAYQTGATHVRTGTARVQTGTTHVQTGTTHVRTGAA